MTNSFDAWAIQLVMGAAAAILSAGLIVLLRPFLVRYALARPNSRSSHFEPTPQGGGIAVIAATTIVVASALVFSPSLFNDPYRLSAVFAAALGLGIVGITDDVRPLEVLPRLLLQGIAVAVVIAFLPLELRIIPVAPRWFEYFCLLIGGIWFVNLVNFMDGIDWMTVAEVVPITAALAAFGLLGALPPGATAVSFALCGAMIGFAPFNRPLAQLFLGDVGSLPIGLLVGWLLLLLAGSGHFVAALLLPLYYLADATFTVLRRLINGESIWQAHRSHYYQRALVKGIGVYQIVGRVFILNVALAGLAALAMLVSTTLQLVSLATGIVLVGCLLWKFASTDKNYDDQ
jgi:UDP-N-acetylmuramyl pentapeptide phosphotransferase/UDP-N-acetylglucosamine-1-phosphate transferase